MAAGCCTAPWEAGRWRATSWANCWPGEATYSAACSALAASRWEKAARNDTPAHFCEHVVVWKSSSLTVTFCVILFSVGIFITECLRSPSSVQSRPGEGFLTQSAATFLWPDGLLEAGDRQDVQPGAHCRGSPTHGGQQEHGEDCRQRDAPEWENSVMNGGRNTFSWNVTPRMTYHGVI